MPAVRTQLELPPGPDDEVLPRAGVDKAPARAAQQSGVLVRAEANLLRFPLFALSTKGLKTLDGIECRGTVRRGGTAHAFSLRVSRNTASLYPGPLARRVHFALLGIATERGLPLTNPVTWTWRDLCRRLGIAYG